MIDCKVFLGKPIDFIPSGSETKTPLCKIYPPKVGDILEGNNISYIGLLTMTQEDIEDSFTAAKNKDLAKVKIPTPFEYLVALSTDANEAKIISAAIEFFIHEPITILGEIGAIMIGDFKEEIKTVKSIEELRMLNADNFF
jgi:hypothetical protein